jgi:hypothetical protein
MNARQAREMTERAMGVKSIKKDDYVRLYVDELLGQIKVLAAQKESEMLFVPPDKWENEVKRKLEELEFVIDKRGQDHYITW